MEVSLGHGPKPHKVELTRTSWYGVIWYLQDTHQNGTLLSLLHPPIISSANPSKTSPHHSVLLFLAPLLHHMSPCLALLCITCLRVCSMSSNPVPVLSFDSPLSFPAILRFPLCQLCPRLLRTSNRSMLSSHRALPIFEQIFAKQSEREHAPGVRLVTIWFGTYGGLRPC
jgi:hypothetical protein